MQGFFEQARRNLSPRQTSTSAKRAREWISKVRVVSPTLPMIPPKINPEVFEQVSLALYNNCWLDITYINAQSKRTKAKVMPLGLAHIKACACSCPAALKATTTPATWRCTAFRQPKAPPCPFERPADFDLQTYDDNGRFAFGHGGQIAIHLWVKDELALLLNESPLSANQTIAPALGQQGGFDLKATLTDSALLVWWLRSQGKSVPGLGA